MTAEMPSHQEQVSERTGQAFERLAEPFRRELKLHCYRMIGSVHEAEDLMQETYIRAWRGYNRFDGRGSFRAWIYRIATNACLDALTSRKNLRRLLPDQRGVATSDMPDGAPAFAPAIDMAWLEPYPDQFLEGIADDAPNPEARYASREAVQLAFIAVIQQLPPRQRAVLLLVDVLGWSAAETATLLGGSTASVNSGLQRARNTLARRYPDGRAPAMQPPDGAQERLIRRYIEAWEGLDLDRFIELLKEDATLAMPPLRQWYAGRDAIRAFHRIVWKSFSGFRLLPTGANGQPALALYGCTVAGGPWSAHSLHVLTLDRDRIAALTLFVKPDSPRLFQAFGFPLSLPDATSAGLP
ncbi:MAG: sigma-70 family RNA polymerase sigma factor [Mesorhizobium sp.]|nr:MAG: sigma-70 family RNA polymerase sigma factor [Mesorhizobium sp.]